MTKAVQSRLARIIMSVGLCGCSRDHLASAVPSGAADAGAALDAGPPTNAAGRWTTVAVPATLTTGDLSIMVDAEGFPHVAYNVSENALSSLRHAWLTREGFGSEQVDAYGRGRHKSWVLGSVEPRLVYDHFVHDGAAYHAVREGRERWGIEVFDLESGSAGATAVWRDERLVMARLTAVRSISPPDEARTLLRHGAVYDGRSLPEPYTRVAAEAVAPYLAMAIDSVGVAYLFYAGPADDYQVFLPLDDGLVPQTLRLVAVTEGQWSEPETLSLGPGIYGGLSLAVSASGTIDVTYSELSSFASVNGDLTTTTAFQVTHLSRAVGEQWSREIVPITPARVAAGSMAVDPNGDLHIAYCAAGASAPCSGVGYARKRDGAWQVETIEEGCARIGDDAALALGADGAVFVAYRGCNRELMVASRSSRP